MNKPGHDRKLPDGFVHAGWRKVRSDGSVKFQSTSRKSPRLSPFIGQWLYCEIDEMWGVDVLVYAIKNSTPAERSEAFRELKRGRPSQCILFRWGVADGD